MSTKAKVVKAFKESGASITSTDLSTINSSLNEDTLNAMAEFDSATFRTLGNGETDINKVTQDDIDKFATKAEDSGPLFDQTALAPAIH